MENSSEADAKRARPASEESAPARCASWAPPSASQLYAAGLQHRAEAVSSAAPSWTVQGSDWRAANFNSADANKEELKRVQAEARRMLMKRP